MGKTTRWFRALLGYKKSSSESSPASRKSEKERKPKLGLNKSNEKINDSAKGSSRYHNAVTTATNGDQPPYTEGLDANKHAIAVAAATAAVAEAALAAAHAAAEVVRLTSGSRSGGGGGGYVSSSGDQRRELAAAIKIQSAFRAYLARRALRALKGLVKLQALVRGRIVRKQSADMLRRMQAMARIQARACATRTSSESSYSTIKSSQFQNHGKATPKRHDRQQHPTSFRIDGQNPKQMLRSGSKSNVVNHNAGEITYPTSNWLDRWMEECTWSNQKDTSLKHGIVDDDRSDKILEIDTWKPHQYPRRSEKTFRSSEYFSAWNDSRQGSTVYETATRHSMKYQNPDPSEASSLRSRYPPESDQVAAWNVDNSPNVHSATSRPGSSSRRGAFSPSRSECARSFFGDYISYPSYMANTESSRAKFRSQSAPKQRLRNDKFGAGRKFAQGLWDAETCSEKDSTAHFSYRSKIGTPIHENSGGLSSTYGFRH